MLSQHFGTLTSEGVVQSTDKKVIIRISGNNDRQCELHVTLNTDGKIDDLRAAIIEMDH
jgi:hypothetical protein